MTIHKKLFTALELPVLTTLLTDADLSFVDVGGRGSAFAGLLPLASFARYYVSEPDAEEAARLQQQLPGEAPWRSVTVVTEAIAPQAGTATLYLTSEPGMSSLLEPDLDIAGRYYVHTKFTVASTATVATLPLDAAAARYGFTDASFLKLDTQGTELEILRSGPRLVADSLLGVSVETSFRRFYKGQALFFEVDEHLQQSGFALFALNRANFRRAGFRQALYSKRVVAWAHCLYFREPDTLLLADADATRRRLSRLLALALAFQYFDLAFEIAGLARAQRLLADGDLAQLDDEIERCAALATRQVVYKGREAGLQEKDVLSPSFRDKYPLN